MTGDGRRESALPEAVLQDAWEASTGAVVPSTGDEGVRVRYPGWRNRGAGPDFRDAVLETGGATLRGDVEVHRDARDWIRHGHVADPRYANVVLHVVGDDADPAPGPARRVSGRALAGAEVSEASSGVPFGCRPLASAGVGDPDSGSARADPAARRASLAATGMARFRVMASRVGARLAATGGGLAAVDQVAFEEVAAALGFAGNEVAMRRCARAVPLAAIRAMPAGRIDGEATRIAGTAAAGSCLDDPAVAALRAVAGLDGPDAALPRDLARPLPIRWHLAGVRPSNHPRRRLAALVAIARAWPDGGIVAATLEILRDTAASPRRAGPRLRRLVAVGAPGPGPASRAGDAVVNALLPLARAAAVRDGDAVAAAQADAAFAVHAPLSVNAVVARVAGRVGVPWREVAPGAAGQQGLIAIWDGPCRPLRCEWCPLVARAMIPPGSPDRFPTRDGGAR